MERFVIATHHKSGTNFWLKFIRDLLATPQYHSFIVDYDATLAASEWDIKFDRHSNFATSENIEVYKGIHSMRHPFSLIYSAALYHGTAGEAWLHEPRSYFGGRSYQEQISSMNTIEEKLIFEMNHQSKPVLRRMASICNDTRFCSVRLENISHDSSMTDLASAFAFIGLYGNELQQWLQIASQHCLWNLSAKPKHSTTGVSKEFLQFFKGAVLSEFRHNFGELETAMGYSND